MSNTQALYDVERQKTVKNVPLLMKLQAQICEVKEVTSRLQQAEAEEKWAEYEHLTLRLTQLNTNVFHEQVTQNTEHNNSDDDFETTPEILVTANKPTETTNSDDDFEAAAAIIETTNKTTETYNSDDDFEIVPDTSNNTVNHNDAVTDLQKGDTFPSVEKLQEELHKLAQTDKFKLRREKDSIVCAYAGLSN